MKFHQKEYVINTVIISIILIVFFVFKHSLKSFNQSLEGYALIDTLYHGSPNNNILNMETNSINVRDENEGGVIFATPSIRLASCFLFKWDDSWVYQRVGSKEKNKAPYYIAMLIADRARFEKLSSLGGTIYILPSGSFSFDLEKGLGIHEWVSKKNVPVLAKIKYPSVLEAMESLGVNVYFLSDEQAKLYKNLPKEHQRSFLENEMNKHDKWWR